MVCIPQSTTTPSLTSCTVLEDSNPLELPVRLIFTLYSTQEPSETCVVRTRGRARPCISFPH
jgi:hypothetical protein